MIDDQLLPSGKQLAQGLFAVRPFENVLLVDTHPGELAPLTAQPIAQSREFFFPGKQRLAFFDPLISVNYWMIFHLGPPW